MLVIFLILIGLAVCSFTPVMLASALEDELNRENPNVK